MLQDKRTKMGTYSIIWRPTFLVSHVLHFPLQTCCWVIIFQKFVNRFALFLNYCWCCRLFVTLTSEETWELLDNDTYFSLEVVKLSWVWNIVFRFVVASSLLWLTIWKIVTKQLKLYGIEEVMAEWSACGRVDPEDLVSSSTSTLTIFNHYRVARN